MYIESYKQSICLDGSPSVSHHIYKIINPLDLVLVLTRNQLREHITSYLSYFGVINVVAVAASPALQSFLL